MAQLGLVWLVVCTLDFCYLASTVYVWRLKQLVWKVRAIIYCGHEHAVQSLSQFSPGLAYHCHLLKERLALSVLGVAQKLMLHDMKKVTILHALPWLYRRRPQPYDNTWKPVHSLLLDRCWYVSCEMDVKYFVGWKFLQRPLFCIGNFFFNFTPGCCGWVCLCTHDGALA